MKLERSINMQNTTGNAPAWSMVSSRWRRPDADRLNRIAAEHGITRSAMIRQAVQAWIAAQQSSATGREVSR